MPTNPPFPRLKNLGSELSPLLHPDRPAVAGSTARSGESTPSWTSYKPLRDQLIAEGKLVPTETPQVLRFAEDVEFASPSAAAAVIFAGNQNDRTAWRVKGTSQAYKDWQEAQIGTAP